MNMKMVKSLEIYHEVLGGIINLPGRGHYTLVYGHGRISELLKVITDC